MKLPGIQYGPVQSLGRRDIAAPMREAQAWSRAAETWGQAIDKIGDDLAQAEASQAIVNGTQKMDEVEQNIQLNPYWDVEKLGEPPEEIKIETRDRLGRQPSYLTHEFASALYDHQAKNIIEEQTKGLSGRARKLVLPQLNAHLAKRRTFVLKEQYERKREHTKGVHLNTMNSLTAQATWDNFDETILRVNESLAAGIKDLSFSMPEAENLRVEYLDRVTTSAVIHEVRQTGHASDLNAIEARILSAQPGRMSNEGLNEALSQIDARRRDIERERGERRGRNFQQLVGGVLRGEIPQDQIPDMISEDVVSAQQGITAFGLAEQAEPTEDTFINAAARDYWLGHIGQLRFGLNDTETLRERNIRLAKDINAAANRAYPDGTPYQGQFAGMSNTDRTYLLKALDTEYNKVLSHPEMERVLSDIRTWTGMDGIVDISQSTNNRQAQLAFNRAAWAYYDRMGIDANLGQWFEDNKRAYHPEVFNKNAPGILQTLGVPAHISTDSRAASQWVDSPQASHLSPERRQSIKEQIVPGKAATVEEEGMNNAMDASGLTETR